jgi:hypothetical protein
MNRMMMPLLVLAMVAVPSLAEAQGRAGGRGGFGGALQNPIGLILTQADSLDLGLTDAEVTQISTIRDELTAQNQPHIQAVQQLLQGLAGGGAPDPGILQEFQQHTAPLQANNQAAIGRVRGLLSADQMTKIDAMLAAQAPAGRGGRGGGGPG